MSSHNAAQRSINRRYTTDLLSLDYPHVGLYDVSERKLWIARRRWGIAPVHISHARLLRGGTQQTSTADKDRFLCYWYHTPGSGEGHVHGYPIEWDEGHLLVRLDPNWNYRSQRFIPGTDTARIEANIEQQYRWGRRIFEAYVAQNPPHPLSWHLIGPRPADSLFYIARIEGRPR